MGIVRHSKVGSKKEEKQLVEKTDLFTPAEAAFQRPIGRRWV